MSRRTGLLVLAAAVVLVGAYLAAARRTTGPPFDPRSTAPDGTAGLVEVVEGFAASLSVLDGEGQLAVPAPSVETAVLLQDRFDRAGAEHLDAWVRAGGVLVVADPGSGLTPPVRGVASGTITVDCDAVALGAVRELHVGDGRTFAPASGGAEGCTGAGGVVVHVEDRGAGSVVAVSSRDLFTNRLLDEADNAVLAVSLLAPASGTDVAFLAPEVLPGQGDRGLVDLVDTPVRAALAQLVVAFLVVALWRGRRLGHPVAEPQPVAVDGSELTAAVGRLLAANRHPERAAELLRRHARRDLAGPLGVPPDVAAGTLVDLVASRSTVSADDARRGFVDPVASDDALVDVARLLARIRQEVLHGRTHA